MNVSSASEKARDFVYGESILLMRSRHGCLLYQVVLTEIIGHVSLGTWHTMWSTKVEQPGTLSVTLLIPTMAQCWELPTWTESEFQTVY